MSQEEKTRHTPTPWVWGMRYVGRYTGETVDGVREYQKIAQAPSGETEPEGSEWEANAQFIALACNLHAELVAAVQRVVQGPHDAEAIADMLPQLRAALAKVPREDKPRE